MTKRLDGKIALITGGASVPGLGSATAQRLAEEGAKVCVTDIDLDGAEAVAKGIRDAGGTAMALKQDVANEADWDSVLDQIAQEWGSLDILVNNAGIAVLRPIENLTSADWNKQLTVNLDSVFFGTRRAVEIMRKAGKGGSIVNLSSVAGLVGVPACSAYAAAKAGVRMFGKTIAIECARDNIRVNLIAPGLFRASLSEGAVTPAPLSLSRTGHPEDIAYAALYLASDEAAWVTGAELVIDGGFTAQ